MNEETQAYPLEPSRDQMRVMVDKAAERVIDHIASLPRQPASYDEHMADAHAKAGSLAESLPERGTDLDGLLDLLFREAVPLSYNTAGPGYLAYIPGGGVFPSAVADFIANAVNRYVGVWVAAPGLAQLELNVVRWFCEIIGYPPRSGGILTSGGSLANFTAVVTARRERLADDFLAGTIYTSDQTHHSVRKAAVLAGFPEGNVREVATNEDYEIRLDDLRQRIAKDREGGLRPFMLVTSAGTTNTGAVDDLGGAADVAEDEGLWLHVDAAYGGFFMLTERGRESMRGIERADSSRSTRTRGCFSRTETDRCWCVIPRPCGGRIRPSPTTCPRCSRTPTWSTSVSYRPSCPGTSGDCERGFPSSSSESTPFARASMKSSISRSGLPTSSERCRTWRSSRSPSSPSPPSVGPPAGYSEDGLNDLNRELLTYVNARQNVYITGTMLRSRYALRICVLSFRTHRDRMKQCIVDIRECIEELARGKWPNSYRQL